MQLCLHAIFCATPCRSVITLILWEHRPGDDDEHVQPVPRFVEVRLLADESHRQNLHTHLGGKEGEDEVIAAGQEATAGRRTDLVDTRLIHAERQTVE